MTPASSSKASQSASHSPGPQPLTAPVPGRLERLRAGAWPLTLKFTLILLVVALLPTLLVSYMSLRGSIAGVARTERANLALGANGLSRQLDQLIEGHRGIVRLLAQEPDVEAFLGAVDGMGDGRGPAVAARLDMLRLANPELANVYLMDRKGDIVAAHDDGLIGSNRIFRDYFVHAIAGKEYTSNLLQGIRTDTSGVYFSAPVRRAGNIVGVAVVKLDGQAVAAILRSVSADFTAFLADADGVLIDYPDAAWRYRTLSPLSAEKAKEIQAASYFPVDALRSLDSRGLELGMAMDWPGSVEFTGPNGEPWIAGVAPMERHDWRVYLAEPQGRFAAPIERLFWQGVWTTGGMGLFVVLVAALLGRTMTRPIMVLTRAATQLKLGEYVQALQRSDLQAVARRKDELGELAQVFHAMGDEVYHREFSLDQEVQVRTRELAEKNSLLEATYQRLDEELKMARDMQQAVLPQTFPQDWRFSVHAGMEPAREMGGDFYDCFPLAGGRYGLLVADVAGKGVPAAFFMAVSSTIVQDVAPEQDEPGRVLAWVNDMLCERNPMELFVTMFYAVYDPARCELHYACAGHNPPLLRKADGSVQVLEVARDLALGVIPGQSYDETRLTLEGGDMLLMFTDGVTEAFSAQGEAYGDSRLQQWLAQRPGSENPRDTVESLEAELNHFMGEAERADDVTLLALQVTGAQNAWRKSWRLAARLEEIPVLAQSVKRLMTEGLSDVVQDLDRLSYQVNLCMDELLTNIILHGLNGDAERWVDVELAREGSWLQITLRDDAPAFDCFAQAASPDLELDVEDRPIGGLGVHLVRTLMDEYRSVYDGSGNTVTLRKRLSLA